MNGFDPENISVTTTSEPVDGGFIDTTQVVFHQPIEITARDMIALFMGWGYPERGTPEYRKLLRQLTDRDETEDLPTWDHAADHYGWRFLLDFADLCMGRTAHHLKNHGMPAGVASMDGRFHVARLLKVPSGVDMIAGAALEDSMVTGNPAEDAERFARRMDEAEAMSTNMPTWIGPLQECLDAHLDTGNAMLARAALMKYPTLRQADQDARLVLVWASMVWLALSNPVALLGDKADLIASTDRTLSKKVTGLLQNQHERDTQYMECPQCHGTNTLELQLDRTPDIHGLQELNAVCNRCGARVSFSPHPVTDAKGRPLHSPNCPNGPKGHRH